MNVIRARLKAGLTKKQKFMLICVILIILGLFGINYYLKKNETFYKEQYRVEFTTKNVEIFVPKYSFFKGVKGILTATFENPKSYDKLTKEVSSYLSTLEEVNCGGNIYYHDKNQNFIIYLYKIHDTFPLRKIEITYAYGNPCKFDN